MEIGSILELINNNFTVVPLGTRCKIVGKPYLGKPYGHVMIDVEWLIPDDWDVIRQSNGGYRLEYFKLVHPYDFVPKSV